MYNRRYKRVSGTPFPLVEIVYDAGVGVFQDTGSVTPAGNTNPVGDWTGTGGHNVIQATSGQRPLMEGTAVRFDGTDDKLRGDSVAGIFQPDSPQGTIYLVFAPKEDVGGTQIGRIVLDLAGGTVFPGTGGLDISTIWDGTGLYLQVNLYDSVNPDTFGVGVIQNYTDYLEDNVPKVFAITFRRTSLENVPKWD
jgi:hypothetical protein